MAEIASSHLIWFPELGYGYFPVKNPTYDEAYFDRYVELSNTQLGRDLNEFRSALVHRYVEPHPSTEVEVLDYGIGCGSFMEAVDLWEGLDAYGYDINPAAVRWMKEENGGYRDFYAPGESWEAVTFWDSLEHIPDPRPALRRCDDLVFVSMPVFINAEHVLRSKHFRRDEHYHYWTRRGFIRFMAEQGFETLEVTNRETILGREDIETFVCRRRL